jgi:hypothetical protein
MVTLTVPDLRSRIRWQRGYNPAHDSYPQGYAHLLSVRRLSLLLGTLADEGGDRVATLWVQHPQARQRPLPIVQDPTGVPEFAALVRRGRLWHEIGSFSSMSEALRALTAALAPGNGRRSV